MTPGRVLAGFALAVSGGLVAGFAAAIAAAIVLGITDLYVTGHGRPSLARPWIDWAFVHASRADAVLLGVSFAVFATVAVAIHRSWSRRPPR